MRYCLAIMLAIGLVPVAYADDQRARINYTLHCQGCHLADAAGHENEVPRMQDFLGWFLHSAEGREFIIRVPGVATSALPDEQLAELMNWLLYNFSSKQLPAAFAPFSVAEVAALRANVEPEPQATRMRILRDIARDSPELADALDKTESR